MADQSDDDFITSREVRRSCGGVTDMCLWRWSRSRGFPEPAAVIGGRRYWRRAEVEAWKSSVGSKPAPRPGAPKPEIADAPAT